MRHLFVVDPLDALLPQADTTIAFMREAMRRGHEVAACQVDQIRLGSGGKAAGDFVELEIRESDDWYSIGGVRTEALAHFDAVWMRKDPPFDINYYFATHLLSMIGGTTLVVNDPRALREANEKLFALRFPQLCPETVVSRRIEDLLQFRQMLGGEMVVKPLDGAGGQGVFHIMPDDRNAIAILEVSTQMEQQYILAQRYVPEIRNGDKRIILVEGEPLGAVLRVPKTTEVRANFHAGGTAEATEITEREREICAQVGPVLRRDGVVFAGIDVIGDWLTEVNVTSPTGIREIEHLDGVRLEAPTLDAVEQRAARLG